MLGEIPRADRRSLLLAARLVSRAVADGPGSDASEGARLLQSDFIWTLLDRDEDATQGVRDALAVAWPALKDALVAAHGAARVARAEKTPLFGFEGAGPKPGLATFEGFAALFGAASSPAHAQQAFDCGYPERDILSPFRAPSDITAPPEELFRNLRIMRNLAAQKPELASFDEKGRQIVDDPTWRQAYDRVQEIGLDAGMLAQMMRLHRNGDQRGVAFFGGFYCDNIGYVMELISHIPGEPIRGVRELAFPKAVAFLRAHLGRTFGQLSDEERALVLANMPEPGSPVAKARGIQRAPRDSDHLHALRMQPFFQLLDVEESIDRAQGLWFLKEVFTIRADLASAWLEPALPRVKQLLLDEDAQVKKGAVELLQQIGPDDLSAPPEDDAALLAWADRAGKHLFPPIRNLNDAIVQLYPSPERDAVV